MAGVIKSLVNARNLKIECARVLHETLLYLFLRMTETMLWKEKERSRIRAVQMVTSESSLVLGGWIDTRIHG